ncbi:EI24 domain-containing protein [Plantactinospora sp. ZYX-F-223]|uniref:EI24 domain-containing protein n=1 Tax=Plantactinospora sp. ZYX-F-223 TaxID=3144103 RepID=UPI0031FC017C
MRTPEPERPVPRRPAGADDPAVPFADLGDHQVGPAEAAMLAPLEPTPVVPQPRWKPRQVPDAEALRQAGRAVATGAAQTATVVATGAAQTAASVATGAARTARTAAHRGTRPIVNLAAGIGYFFRGAGRFLGSPALWPYAVAPLVLLALVMLGIAHAVEAGAAAVIGWLTSFAETWPQWIHSTLGEILLWGVRIGIHFALGYLVLPLSIVLGAPCYVLLARRLERRLGPVEPVVGVDPGATDRMPSLWRASGVAIRQAVLVTLVVQLGWLLLVPLLLVPGLNVFVAIGAVAVFNGFLVGLLMLAIPLHHHGASTFRGQFRTVWRHRASVIGFGATSGLLLGVPFTPLRALVAPMVFTGAVLLHRRMRRADAVTRRDRASDCTDLHHR